MTESAPGEGQPPPRFLLRPAGVLTQLICAFALLLGTITFILVQQNKTGGAPLVIAWAAAAMAGVVFGGLMARGGMVSVLVGATIDGAFGIVLFVIDWDALRSLLRLLPESDVAMIADVLVGIAILMVATSALCLASIPQARAYNRALREAEAEAEKSGFFQAAASGGVMPQQMQVPVTVPPRRRTSPVAVPPPPQPQPMPSFRGGAGSATAHTSSTPSASPAMQPVMRISERPLPLPAPPVTADGYTPPPPGGPGAHDDAPAEMPPPAEEFQASASTAPGWAPAPARTFTTMMIVRPPAAEKRSRQRVYIMLGGFAIGLGAGVGVLVSSIQNEKRAEIAAAGSNATGSASPTPSPVGSGSGSGSAVAAVIAPPSDAGAAIAVSDAAPPPPPLHTFLDTQRDLIGQADLAKLATTFAPTVFAIGIDAEDVAEGRDAVEAMLTKNLGDPPPDGFKVTSRFLAIGQELDIAWTAEELELSGPNLAPRRIVITQFATATNGTWSVAALCWAQPVRDDTAERLAILGTLPKPRAIANRADGDEFAKVVAATFASRRAFADARSERDDGFNFGSGPNERIVGGAKIKSLFGRLRAELHIDGGARVVAVGPTAGFAALNTTFTQKGRAATDVTQTFRVLAVFLKEGTTWKIVQTQFSNAGPISD